MPVSQCSCGGPDDPGTLVATDTMEGIAAAMEAAQKKRPGRSTGLMDMPVMVVDDMRRRVALSPTPCETAAIRLRKPLAAKALRCLERITPPAILVYIYLGLGMNGLELAATVHTL